MKTYRTIKRLIIISFITIGLIGCGNDNPQPQVQQVRVQTQQPDQLINLRTLHNIAKNVSSPEELEQIINSPSFNHNIDMNEDGSPDYLTINELRENGRIVFQIGVKTTPTNFEEITRINIESNGNIRIVGHSRYYNDSDVIVGALVGAVVLNSIFGSRPVYVSPYHVGYVPTHYHTTYMTRPRVSQHVIIRGQSVQRITVIKPTKFDAPKIDSSYKPPIVPKRNTIFSQDKQFDENIKHNDVKSGSVGIQKPISQTPMKPTINSSGGFGKSRQVEQKPSIPSSNIKSGSFGKSSSTIPSKRSR